MRAQALLTKAISLHQQGKHEEAEASYRAVLKKHPKNFTALHYLGVLASDQKKLDKAHELISQALALDSRSSEAHSNLGNVLRAQGKLEEAAAAYRRAAQFNPRSVAALSNIALTLMDQKKNLEAIAVLEKAMTIDPCFFLVRFNLGVAYSGIGQHNKAIAEYRAAIEINPSLVPSYINLGDLLFNLGQLNEAIDVLQKATQLQENPDALNNLGTCYHRTARIKEAEECFREAIRLKPDFDKALTNLGLNIAQQGRHEEAVAVYRAALRVNPNSALAVSNLFFEQRHLSDWQDFEATESRLRDLVRAGVRFPPFAFATANTPPNEQLICARTWAASLSLPLQSVSSSPASHRAERIRIGYLSCDFNEHATAFLMAEMLEHHDHQRFEIFAYSFSIDDGSAIHRRVIAAFDHFVDISAMPHEAAIRKIREDGIDILVDLKGYTRNARTEIMVGRPAPIQVNYLGYPGTMGADCIDYMIADHFVVPADQRQHFSEKLVYLPHCYQPNDTKRTVSSLGFTRRQFGLPEDGFVFCSFNGNYKITPSFFDVWMRLLKKTPGSVLWLLETGTRVNLLREAEARGVAPERIVFAQGLIHSQHLERIVLADLFLDSLPVNAHTTASDALWAGLPILTCAGKTFVGRVAGSLLHSIGLPELITSSLEEYEAKANHLAQNPPELLALRDRLAQKRQTSPLFDIARFTRNLETAYQMMFDRWQAGLIPDTLSVEENSAAPRPDPLLSLAQAEAGRTRIEPAVERASADMRFPDIFIINLDNRVDRWTVINDLCTECGLFAQRISAVRASPGWVGCGLSHLKCIEVAKERNLPWVLIMEDDAQFTRSTIERFRNLLPYLWEKRHKWEKFSGGPTYAPDFNACCLDIHHQVVYANGLCTHFDLINQNGYDKVLGWNPEFNIPIDLYHYILSRDKAGFRCVCTYPHLAIQRPSRSNIELSDDVTDYNNYFRCSELKIRECINITPLPRSEAVIFKTIHPDWCGTLLLSRIGNFLRRDGCTASGTYSWSGDRLIVNWYDYEQEAFFNIDGLLVDTRLARNAPQLGWTGLGPAGINLR